MSGSTITAFSPIAEGSDGTPGLWNSRFQTLQDNIVSVNSAVVAPVNLSGSTWASIGLNANSSNSDYIRFYDSSAQRSTYRLGSAAGGTADGLNIFDESGNTMIVSFSKQSVRFFQNITGPVFDVGGALANTLNAATFGTATDSKESRIQAAIEAAANSHISTVYLPATLIPYSASSVSFIYSVKLTREGGNDQGYDVVAYGARTDGVTDSTSAMRAACAALTANGGGLIDFGGSSYAVFPGSHTTERPSLMSFSGISGFELRAAGAKFIVTGDFPVTSVRAKIFSFESCHNITIGDFVCDATGDRKTGGSEATIWMYRRGGVFSLFTGANNTGIKGGILNVANFSVGYWFTQNAGLAIEGGSRNIAIAGISANSVGYPLLTNAAGHNMTANIDSVACGRSGEIQDSLNVDIVIKSKNPDASQDVGIGGSTSGRLRYINTESTIPIDRLCALHFPVPDTGPARVTSDMKIELDIDTSACTSVGRGFTLGLATGTLGSSIDTLYKLYNLEVTGRVHIGTGGAGARQPVVVDFPSVWTEGANMDNVAFRNLSLRGTAQNQFDLRGARRAILENVVSESILQLQGGSTESSKVIAINVRAPELQTSLDTSCIDFYSCHATTGAAFGETNKSFYNTYVAGVLKNSVRSNVSFQGQAHFLDNALVASTKTLSLDGGGDTGIREDSANQLVMRAGGQPNLQIFPTIISLLTGASIEPAKRLYMDGGGDTYIVESSSNQLSLVAGNERNLDIYPTIISMLTGLALEPTRRLYMDGGVNTYVQESSADQFAIVAGGTNAVSVVASGISVGVGGTPIPAMSSMSSKIGAFVVAGSSSSFTIVTWAAVLPGDQIHTTVFPDAAVSSISSGLIPHSHCTKAGQIEFRLSNVSTLVQNQSSKTWYFTRTTPF